MLEEQDPNFIGNITIAAKWWKENFTLSPQQGKDFEASMVKHCAKKFTNHWFPHNPLRGQGYRYCVQTWVCRIFPSYFAGQ
jgi:hypothetical protein